MRIIDEMQSFMCPKCGLFKSGYDVAVCHICDVEMELANDSTTAHSLNVTGSTAVLCPVCNKRYRLGERCGCPPVTASDARLGVGSPPTSILTEAASLISGERRDAYGSYSNESKRIAAMWSVILNTTVKPEQVPLCMIALKLVRESHQHKRDSLVDIAGYAALLDQLYEK